MGRIFTITLLFMSLFSQAQVINDNLIARNTGLYPMYSGDTVRVMGFTKTLGGAVNIPGPTLIYNEGDSVILDLWNVSQGAPHTIHLHGLDVDQANDGVPQLSFSVGHMEHGFYHFTAPHAGTYMYHCHVVSTIHVQAGMYGLLIVKPPNGSNTTWNGGHAYDDEIAWMTSEIDPVWHSDSIIQHPYDSNIVFNLIEIPEYDPQFFLVNGLSEHQLNDNKVAISSSVNSTFYLRLANVGFCENKFIFPSSLNARIVSSDGRPLPVEEISDTLLVFPGERYGVLFEPLVEFEDSIQLDYSNLNNGMVHSTQYVPVSISGFLGENELESTGFHYYPNPTKGSLTIEHNYQESRLAEIYNILGVQVQVEELSSSKVELYLGDLESGIYFIKIGTHLERIVLCH